MNTSSNFELIEHLSAYQNPYISTPLAVGQLCWAWDNTDEEDELPVFGRYEGTNHFGYHLVSVYGEGVFEKVAPFEGKLPYKIIENQ